jgi:D-3-phosphoglycerate dehydrogenase
VGFDGIDVTAARLRGICVTNVPDYCTEEVSDHALALILTLIRKVVIANSDVQQGRWDQLSYRPIRRVNGLTLGLIGFGRLARALARKAGALGMRVIAHDPYASVDSAGAVELVSLEKLLESADAISLHAPLLPETKGIIGLQTLRQMKPGAILVNTSRGELVDEAALAAALDSGSLSGAALDVFCHEPLTMSSSLRGRANVILTPHIAFYSEQSLIDLQQTAAADVARALSGETPLHRVA